MVLEKVGSVEAVEAADLVGEEEEGEEGEEGEALFLLLHLPQPQYLLLYPQQFLQRFLELL